MPSPCDTPAIGYVLKTYPRISETFVVTEILARENNGERVEIASLRPPADGRFHADVARVSATVTWISDDARSLQTVWSRLRESSATLPLFDECVGELMAHDARDVVQAVEVARWALDNHVDHLHAHFATTATVVARLAAKLTGLPYSFTAHAKDIFHESVDDDRLRMALRDAHHVVTVSDHNLEHLRCRFPDATGRLYRVYNGVDVERLRPRPRNSAMPARVVGVGRLVEKKGFADLIDAVAVLRSRGLDVPTTIAGAGRLHDDLRRQIVDAGLEDLVNMTGALTQADVHDLVAAGSVFVAPVVVADDGDRDGLPTVLLEAMALGTPVIATPVTGIPEAVVDEVTGLLVPERDPYSLADAITRVLEDPVLVEGLVRNARSLVDRRFDARIQAVELAALCRPVVARSEVGA